MKTRNIARCLLAFALVSSASAATIQFSLGFTPGSGLSTNLANAAGIVTNGLSYGIIVNTDGTPLLSTYDVISGPALTSGGLATGDVFFLGGTLSDTSQGGVFTEGDFTTPGGPGGAAGFSFAYSNGAAAGQSYALVWFDSNPSGPGSAGILTSPVFVLPPAADTVDHSAPFLGVDPVRPATGITFVPEPSAALLGAIGALGLLRRRRA